VCDRTRNGRAGLPNKVTVDIGGAEKKTGGSLEEVKVMLAIKKITHEKNAPPFMPRQQQQRDHVWGIRKIKKTGKKKKVQTTGRKGVESNAKKHRVDGIG